MRNRLTVTLACLIGLALPRPFLALAQNTEGGSLSAPEMLSGKQIDQGSMISLPGHVLRNLTPERDMGAVEDSAPQRLYLVLKRSPAQQADLDALLAAQQNSASPEYHKWLTPQQFGERFGAAQADIHKIKIWLVSQGFQVTSVAHNASVINFTATAGDLRHTFHADLHYWNVDGGKHIATANEPEIPAALADVVSGIAGLNQIPPHTHHTPIHQERYDAETHKWYPVNAASGAAGPQPHYNAGNGNYNMTPQDFYTIYNVNPTFTAGNRGASSTIGILGSGPFNYGAVTNGKAAGGDVTTFRNLFGITTPLNLLIQNGDANFPCTLATVGDSGESALDVEWAGATAPGATLIFESCASNSDGSGFNFLTETQALVDANVADIITSSIGFTESGMDASGNQAFDTAFAQAAAQGQTILSAQGDSGSDDADFGKPQGTSGLTVDYPGTSPLVLSIGGTDFQDKYDVDLGSSTPQSAYWSATNSQFYGDALSYIPETTWNDSCGSSIIASDSNYGGTPGETTATYCNGPNGQHAGGGSGGGISGIYAQPLWQKGIPGLNPSITKRATPDVSLFASTGAYWGHSIVVCDSGDPAGGKGCASPDTFGFAGGTSFAAPQFAGILGLLQTATNSRQGLVQPALYALARAQYAAGTACYANGQTANTGITTGLPASSCIFNDVTTSGNNNECQAGTPDCFTNPGASYGVFTSSGNTSIFVDAYAAAPQYDLATGLGSVNVTNLINKWNTAFTSSTSLMANPTSITTAQSTTLTAAVTGGTPNGYNGTAPTLSGTVTFKAGSTTLGSCTVSGSGCSIVVSGSKLMTGPNSITATFAGSGTYPPSTSGGVTVTVTAVSTGGFTITAIPPAETIKRGVLGGFILKLVSTNGFKGKVMLSCSGGPVGTKCTDFPMTVSLNGTAYALSGLVFPRNSTPGTYMITFTGVSGTTTGTGTAKFTLY